MSIQRPKTPDQIYQETVALRQQQTANLKALKESASAKLRDEQEKAALEATNLAAEEAAKRDVAVNDLADKNRKSVIKTAAFECMNHLKADGMQKVRDKVMFEIVYESLWVDDDVKREELKTIFECYKDTTAFLKKTCPNAFNAPKTRITSGVEAVIEETVNEACRRITETFGTAVKNDDYTEELLAKLRFNLTTEEEAKMDAKLSDLGKGQIVNLVKKKVLNVVQDEKKRGEKRAALFDELDEAAKDDDEEENDTATADTTGEPDATDTSDEDEAAVTSDDTVGEEDTAPDESGTEESTMIDDGEEVEEIAKLKTFWGKREAKLKRRKENTLFGKKDKTKDKALESLVMQRTIQDINRTGATSIFEGLNMFNRMATQIEIAQNETICGIAVEEASIPQMVSAASMIQTITQYTVMEALNTMKYCNLNSTDANRIRMGLNQATSKIVRNMDAAMETMNLNLCSQL